jgi:hypothetical protein
MLQVFDSAPAGSQHPAESPFAKPTWRKAGKAYRALLFGSGEEQVNADGETVRSGIPAKKVAEALAKGHNLELAEVIRCRVRYFCDGLVFGTADFVEGVFQSTRDRFSPRRQTGPRKMRGAKWGDLRTMRDLRENVFGSG